MGENLGTIPTKVNLPDRPKILLVRTDKIGDLLLTTPALRLLKERYPKASIGYLANSYAAPLLENNPNIDHIIPVEIDTSIWNLARKLKEHRYDCSVHFYIDSKSSLAAFLAHILKRIGPFSKPASLLLTHRIRQNRSGALMHEADYNIDILKPLGVTPKQIPPKIYLKDEEIRWGKDNLKSILRSPKSKIVLIHPGSKGSAQSWPFEHFIELSKRIAKNLGEVLFTGGAGEEILLEKVSAMNEPNIHTIPAGSLNLRQFASLIANVEVLVSNSTGPLHMAVALNKPTLSFYPKLPIVTSSKRWGPYSKETFHKVLEPVKPSDPMSSISVEEAFEGVKSLF